MILILFEEQHRRESPHHARLSVLCLRYKQSQILPVYVSFEGFQSPDQAGLMTEFSSLNSYLWKLIPGFELRPFAGYTVCKPPTGCNTYLKTVLLVCSDIGPVNFAFTTICIPCLFPGPFSHFCFVTSYRGKFVWLGLYMVLGWGGGGCAVD
jgi:hypothetical protein